MKPTKFSFFKIAAVILLLLTSGSSLIAQKSGKNYLDFRTAKKQRNYFKYKNDGSILVSGHRGGRERGFPENSLEGFENVLRQMPAIFEIDPRLTKDSVIVLMHDATLDRTTTAKGKLADYTWTELQSVRLKDSEGNVTPSKIPRLDDVIVWSKGKTIINLDKKDVPMHMIAELVRKYRAERYVMLTVHNGKQARYYFDRFPDIMFSAFARNDKEYEDIDKSGVPWGNMIAYVGPTITSENMKIVDALHAKGVRCMVSYAPTHDKLKTSTERKKAYSEEIKANPDVVESDLPTEVWSVLQKKDSRK